MPVRAGQRCSAWRVRRCRRLVLVESGGGRSCEYRDRRTAAGPCGHGAQVAVTVLATAVGRTGRRGAFWPAPPVHCGAGRPGQSPRLRVARHAWGAAVEVSAAELAGEAVTAGIVADISASTVARWLATDALKPWQYRSWIAPQPRLLAASRDSARPLRRRPERRAARQRRLRALPHTTPDPSRRQRDPRRTYGEDHLG
jgi:hypothetical protein